jgi:hypothetical protein
MTMIGKIDIRLAVMEAIIRRTYVGVLKER